MIEFTLQPREGVGELIEKYLNGEIEYAGTSTSLYAQVRAMGYNCNSLYEMVVSAEIMRKRQINVS